MALASDAVPTAYVDGILDVQNLGMTVGIIYFEYVRPRHGALLVKVPSFRMIRPKDSVHPSGNVSRRLALEPDPRQIAMMLS